MLIRPEVYNCDDGKLSRISSVYQKELTVTASSKYTVNDLIKAHFQINASYLINAPSTLLKLYYTPLSNKRSLSNGRPL